MKKLITILLLLIVSQAFAVELPKGTASVKAYLFDCTLGSGNPLSSTPLLNKDMTLTKGVIGKPVVLSDLQVDTFLGAFDEKNKFFAAAGCHIPHHGLVFLNKDGKAIGYYEVCFECGNVGTSINAYQGVGIDLKAMKQLFKNLQFPILKTFGEYSALYKKQKDNN